MIAKPLIVLALLCFIPSWASDPGEPPSTGDEEAPSLPSCNTHRLKIRSLDGDALHAALVDLTEACFSGTWVGTLRHFFPGRKYPYDHFCCPEARMHFKASGDVIRGSLREEDQPFERVFSCLPSGDEYECSSQTPLPLNCRLEGRPLEAERFLGIRIECSDDAGHTRLTVSLEDVTATPAEIRGIRSQEARIQFQDAIANEPSLAERIRFSLRHLDSTDVKQDAREYILRTNDSCSVADLVVDFLMDRQSYWILREEAASLMPLITGKTLAQTRPRFWVRWWEANRESYEHNLCPAGPETP